MRTTFIDTLTDLAGENPNVYLLTGDLGYSVLERFRDRYPDRFLNAGVAEANMVGVSAGLALSGKIPVLYSITPFTVFRPFEQIRIDICYQNLGVKIVGIGTGFDYGTSGTTHHALEDIAVMRSLPGMKILSPCDIHEVKSCVKLMVMENGPCYLRLAHRKSTVVHSEDVDVKFGEGVYIQRGEEIALVASGSMVSLGLPVVRNLEDAGYSVTLVSMPSLKPFDEALTGHLADTHGALFTLEEHSIIGGLGSIVSEILSERSSNPVFKRFGLLDNYPDAVGTSSYLLSEAGLSTEALTEEILKIMRDRVKTDV